MGGCKLNARCWGTVLWGSPGSTLQRLPICQRDAETQSIWTWRLAKKHGPDLPLHALDAAGHQNSFAASAFVSHVPAGCLLQAAMGGLTASFPLCLLCILKFHRWIDFQCCLTCRQVKPTGPNVSTPMVFTEAEPNLHSTGRKLQYFRNVKKPVLTERLTKQHAKQCLKCSMNGGSSQSRPAKYKDLI